LSEIQIIAYFYVDVHNLLKIGRSAAKLLRIAIFFWYDECRYSRNPQVDRPLAKTRLKTSKKTSKQNKTVILDFRPLNKFITCGLPLHGNPAGKKIKTYKHHIFAVYLERSEVK